MEYVNQFYMDKKHDDAYLKEWFTKNQAQFSQWKARHILIRAQNAAELVQAGKVRYIGCSNYAAWQLMKALGAKTYRFSIAWPRVFPEGTGSPNPKGLDFYNRLVDELLANGIAPFATLYHWDLPQALQDRFGGWTSRDTSKAFADYSAYVAGRLGDRVKHFFTINECSRLVHHGHEWGADAPGLKLSPSDVKQVRHNVALGHGLAVQAIRANGQAGIKVGPAENAVSCIPAIETPANIRAAEIATRELNAGYLTVMLEGKYTDAYLAQAGKETNGDPHRVQRTPGVADCGHCHVTSGRWRR